MKVSLHKLCLATTILAGCLPGQAFSALKGEVLVGYTAGYDDNISRGNQFQGQEEDISNEIYAEVDLTKATGFFRYDLYGHAGFLSHSADEVDDQFNVSGGFDALWLAIPNRLSWDISDVAYLQRRNNRELTSSSNTEQINVFRTGPTLYFHPTGRTYLNVGAYYEQTYAEFGDDNEYLGANFQGIYRFSDLTRLIMTGSEVHYMPDDVNFSDQITRSVSAQLRHQMQKGVWYLGGGVSQVIIDDSGISDDEDLIPTYVAGYVYQLARRLEFDLSAERQIVTFGQDTLNSQDRGSLIGDLNALGQQQNSNPTGIQGPDFGALSQEISDFSYSSGFNVDDTVQAGLTWRDGQWGSKFRVYARRLEVPDFQINLSQEARSLLFPEGLLDAGQESYGADWTVSLEPRIRWLVDAGIRYEERKIDSVDALADDSTFGEVTTRNLREMTFTSQVSFAATRYLSFGGTLESRILEDTDSDEEVKSNRIFLTVEYSL